MFRQPDIEIEAIFTGSGVVKDHVIKDAGLHTARAEIDGLAYARPRRGGLRRLPTEWTDRRSGVGNALKGAHLAIGTDDTFNYSRFDLLLNMLEFLSNEKAREEKEQSERDLNGAKRRAAETRHGEWLCHDAATVAHGTRANHRGHRPFRITIVSLFVHKYVPREHHENRDAVVLCFVWKCSHECTGIHQRRGKLSRRT